MTYNRRELFRKAATLGGVVVIGSATSLGAGCSAEIAVEAHGAKLIDVLQKVGFRPIHFRGRHIDGTVIAMADEDATSMHPHDGAFWVVRDASGHLIESPDVWNMVPRGIVTVSREPYRASDNPRHSEWQAAKR